jgi:hypothetical protein
MAVRSGAGPSEKLNARIQFFGYNAARSTRRPLEKTEKFRLGTKAAGGTAFAKMVFYVSAFSGGHSSGREVSVIVLRFLFALPKFLAEGRV